MPKAGRLVCFVNIVAKQLKVSFFYSQNPPAGITVNKPQLLIMIIVSKLGSVLMLVIVRMVNVKAVVHVL